MNYENRDWCVNRLIDNGAWKTGLIQSMFPADIAIAIYTLHIPKLIKVQDRCIWPYAKDGEATVRLIYKSLSSKHDPNWKGRTFIWKAKIPPKIKVFIWSIIKKKLPVRARLNKIINYINPLCPRCCVAIETLDHLLIIC